VLCFILVNRCRIINYDFKRVGGLVLEILNRAFNDAKNVKTLVPHSGSA